MRAESTARGLRRTPSSAPVNSLPQQKPKKARKIKYNIFTLGAGLDMPMLFLIMILLAIGLVMLFSASYAYCYAQFGDSYYFIKRQAIFAVAGVIAMILVSTFDYHHYHKFAWPLLIITVVVLVIMIIPPIKGTALVPNKNGAYRWLNLGFVEFQPSEIAKFALILVFAHMISQRVNEMDSFKKGFLAFLGPLALLAGLVVAEKHMSATIILMAIGLIMMFIGGVKIRYFMLLVGIAVGGLAVLLFTSDTFAHSLDRLEGWFDPFSIHQTKQSLYAIGSGQFLGLGLGQSRQKYRYLPEPQNDFIFSIVCEELGFVGALIIIGLFAALIWRGVKISLNAKDKFGTMLGLGITFQVGLQIVLNICVVTNTIPNTGISLPFFSYGGTSLLILLFEMGILLQISRSSNVEKT